MRNPQHFSTKSEHYTPTGILKRCRQTVNSDIDLDAASDLNANTNVKANTFYSWADDPISDFVHWGATNVFCNPPGGRLGNRSLSALFWDKFISEHRKHHFEVGFFLGFSLELLPKRLDILHEHVLFFGNLFPDDPGSRPAFLTSGGRVKFLNEQFALQKSPTHGSFLVFVSHDVKKYKHFKQNFNDCGRIAYTCR